MSMNTHTPPTYTIDPDDYCAAVAAITESRLMFAVAPIDYLNDQHPVVGVIVMHSNEGLAALVYVDHEYVTTIHHGDARARGDVSATATELAHTIATALRSHGYAVEL